MDNYSQNKSKPFGYVVPGIFIIAVVVLLYFVPRSNFFLTYTLFIISFLCNYFILKQSELFSMRFCIGLAISLRLIAVFSLPALSDDYFRFIWDGKMFLNHINPFAYTPKEYLAIHSNTQLNFLYNNLIAESQEAYTIYPAVLQYIFAAAAYLFPNSAYGAAVVMKLFIFTAECFSIYGLYLFSKLKQLPVRDILWYALNPLIIVELIGNVHFEALMICFLLFTFYFLQKDSILLTALFWALAINAKLLPIMLAPLLLMYLGFWRFVKLGLLTASILVISSIPLIDKQLFSHLGDSVGKYYNLFEFNASFYYLAARTSELFSPVDHTQEIAAVLGIISFLGILFISFYKFTKDAFLERVLWIFFFYFLCAAMVHPWYISTLVMLSAFSRYKFPVVFSLLIPLSYFPYWLKEYDENMYVILLEYSLLFTFMLFEWKKIKKEQQALI